MKCIAHCDKGYKKSLQEIYQPGQDITILIGPEGDFSGNEITLALENNLIPVTPEKVACERRLPELLLAIVSIL